MQRAWDVPLHDTCTAQQSWTPIHPLPRRAIEKSRMGSAASDRKTTPPYTALDPLVAPMKT